MTALPDTHAQVPSTEGIGKILVVDDSPHTATSLARLLNKASYETCIAMRGSDALACAQANLLTAAVIDIHLPDINGLVLSQRLRELMGPDKPIIVLSGDTSMEVINSLPHVGATYFFSKPVNAKQLLQKLKQTMSAAGNDA